MTTNKEACIVTCTDTDTGERYSVICNGEEVIIKHHRTVLKLWARVALSIIVALVVLAIGILLAKSVVNTTRDVAHACDEYAGRTCSWYEVEKFPKMSEQEKQIMFGR